MTKKKKTKTYICDSCGDYAGTVYGDSNIKKKGKLGYWKCDDCHDTGK